MLAIGSYRLNPIKTEAENSVLPDAEVLERTLACTIEALERLAGVTVAELGFGDYFSHARTIDELVAAAAKVEAEHDRKEAQP